MKRNIPYVTTENVPQSYFSKLFTSQEAINDIKSQKQNLLKETKKKIQNRFQELSGLLTNDYFVLTMLNCSLQPKKFLSDSDLLQIINQNDVRRLFLDLSFDQFLKTCRTFFRSAFL